jgi:uncharacterized glyoxalase superfamily protein PhnB
MNSSIEFQKVIPTLRIFSVDKAMEFYVGFLGFKVDFEHRFGENFPLFAQVSRAGVALCLSEHHGDASPGSAITIRMQGITEYHRELTVKDYRYAKPGLEETPGTPGR